MSRYDFPKDNRLLNRKDFTRVYQNGRFWDTNAFGFYVLEKEEESPRLGIVTPKQLGSAVERNRVKRVVRETFRKNKTRFSHLDLIIKPKKRAVYLDNLELSEYLLEDFPASYRGGHNGEHN